MAAQCSVAPKYSARFAPLANVDCIYAPSAKSSSSATQNESTFLRQWFVALSVAGISGINVVPSTVDRSVASGNTQNALAWSPSCRMSVDG